MAEAGQAPKPAPLLFPEALQHYFNIGNELYERKVRGDTSEMTKAIQEVLDALARDLTTSLPEEDRELLLSAMREEQKCERWTVWVRRTADKLNTSRPGLLSLELLGSAGVVVAVAYYILRVDVTLALLFGLVLVGLRLLVPRVMLKLAVHEERRLRKLRRISEEP